MSRGRCSYWTDYVNKIVNARQHGNAFPVLRDIVAYVNLLDRRVLDRGSGPGHALSASGDFFPNRMEGFEGLRPEAR